MTLARSIGLFPTSVGPEGGRSLPPEGGFNLVGFSLNETTTSIKKRPRYEYTYRDQPEAGPQLEMRQEVESIELPHF